MRDLAPQHQAHWFEIHGKVATMGESINFANEAKAVGRNYDARAYRMASADAGTLSASNYQNSHGPRRACSPRIPSRRP